MVLKKRSKVILTICGLLVVIGAIIFISPMGRTETQNGSCGPRAVTALLQNIDIGAIDNEVTSERVKAEFRAWDYIPERIPFVGGATLPWGIKHVLEKMGLSGQVEFGLDLRSQQEIPFIALIRDSQWHYVTVFEMGEDTVLTNDGRQSTDDFLGKWKWSGYWRCHLDNSNKEVTEH